jgi:hypothetical protein
VTLRRWLARAVEGKTVLSEGTGRKSNRFRYWLNETEAKWRERNPFYDRLEAQARALKLGFRSLQEHKRNGWPDDDTLPLDDDDDDGDDE